MGMGGVVCILSMQGTGFEPVKPEGVRFTV